MLIKCLFIPSVVMIAAIAVLGLKYIYDNILLEIYRRSLKYPPISDFGIWDDLLCPFMPTLVLILMIIGLIKL